MSHTATTLANKLVEMNKENNMKFGTVVFRDGEWVIVWDWTVDWTHTEIRGLYKIGHYCHGESKLEIFHEMWEEAGRCLGCHHPAPKELEGFLKLLRWER